MSGHGNDRSRNDAGIICEMTGIGEPQRGDGNQKNICIGGETMRSNKCKEGKPSHIVTDCAGKIDLVGVKKRSGKKHEIIAIAELLGRIQI